MRIVIASDTHKKPLSSLNIPDGDLFIHCGDFTSRLERVTGYRQRFWQGGPDERPARPQPEFRPVSREDHLAQVAAFNDELGALPHQYKVVVGGNHDAPLEWLGEAAGSLLSNAVYLQDELVEIAGLRIYGSPWQPEHHKWAFNLPRGSAELAAVWAKVPDLVDVLITHGPPKGILDRTPEWPSVGDELLLDRVMAVRPLLHCFGHVHQSYGKLERDGIIFVNACVLDERYNIRNAPIVIDL